MKKELADQLVKKYPEMLRDYGGDPTKTCMAWGFECGDGWFPLIKEVCEKVADIPGFKFEQVKEKFGRLTIYFSGPENDKDYDYVNQVVNEAENKSCQVCEVCGAPGKRESHYGWISTECKTCKAIRDARQQIS